VNRSRLRNLERRLKELPCPRCGKAGAGERHLRHLPSSAAGAPGQLSDGERREIERIKAKTSRRCPACGRLEIDLTLATDDEKRRVLDILRRLFAPELATRVVH
jgi:predicted RNA-binding Zn-ribbon protein involved in translation (DUF1610 family)